ncbi:ABC transporter permease [Actinomadura sp. HBU206391]|nr:ABC transporter permease [Actinomadura sp. HBU206391]
MARLTLRNLAAHRLRLGLTALAVILGVSFVSGTLIFKDTMTRSFDGLFGDVYKGVEVIVRAERSFAATEEDPARPIPQSVLTTIRQKAAGAAGAQGASEGYAAIVGADGKVVGGQGMTHLGGDWSDDTGSELRIVSGRPPRAPGEVVIDSVTAGKGGLEAGDQVKILTQGPTQTMRVTGIFTLGSLSGLDRFLTYALFTPEVAQRLLVKPGHYSEIYVQARPGVSTEHLRDQVAAVLPEGYEAVTGQDEADETQAEIKQIFDFLAIFLLVFAAVAVFVGSFIIFNTFAMLVAQRTRELALLRAVGASRRQVTRSVLGEAAGVGFVGSTLGLGLGAGLALGLRALFALFGVDLPATRPVLAASTALWSYAVGMLVTVAAAYFPARRAAKIPPVAAMRDDVGGLPERSMRVRVAVGTALMVLGGAAVARGLAISGEAISGEEGVSLVGLGGAVVFLGVVMLGPVLSRPITWVLGWPFARLAGSVGRMSRENTRRNPRRTAATASALMIGLALVAMVSVLAQSMKASADGAFDRDLSADYTLQPTGLGGFSPEAVEAVSEAPGVSGVTPVRLGTIKLAGEKAPVMVADPAALAGPINLEIESGTGALGPDELLVQRNVADQWGWTIGSTVPGEYPDGVKAPFRVAGIYADNQVASSPYLMTPAGYRPHAPSELIQLAYVDTDEDARAGRSLESALAAYPNVKLQDRQETKAAARQEIDQLLTVVIALLVLSIIIAALGIVNTLALSVIERTREIGLLRAVGMSRRQLRRMVRYESVVIAAFGATLGLAVGVAFGWALQRAMEEQGVDVLSIPYGRLGLYAVAAAVIGVIAAIWPARRAARMDVLRAVTTE